MKKTTIKNIFKNCKTDASYLVSGWVRTKRGSKNIAFIMLNDGSCFSDLQVILDMTVDLENILKRVNTGSSISVFGKLVKSTGQGQKVELIAKEIKVIGISEPEKYPIQPKKHTLDFLRKNAHLRFRTKTFSSVFRIRHALSFAIHQFFNDQNFYYINTPIITSADAEGAGEMFKVTTFDMLNIPKKDDGSVDYDHDFLAQSANITV